MGKDYTNKGEYQGNEHSADVFTAPKKKLTKEERKQQSDMKKRKYLDTGELDTKGNPLMIKQAGPDYAGEKAKVGTFDKDMGAYRKAKDAGNLTNEDRIRILKENAGKYGKIAGRTALAIKPDLKTTLGIALPFLSLLINNPTRRLGGAF